MKKYIDLDEAIDTLKDYFCDPGIGWDETGQTIIDVCEVLLGKLPAEDVRENVKGEWIWVKENNISLFPVGRCSVCHCLHAGVSNFCPNCGAYMGGEKDG